LSPILDPGRILTDVALVAAAGAAVLLVAYLVRRPALSRRTKLWLFAALGPLPITAAMIGNVANFEVTKDRAFCARCHTMDLYADDAADPKSSSLAALHSRGPMFGGQSCYICHADYGMFGMPLTKLGGMRHVWYYYTENWEAPGHRPPKLLKPYSHEACKQCHLPGGPRQPLEHQVHLKAILDNEVGCTAAGCHGRPHPVNRATVQIPAGAASERAP
jgi:cytochrome c-type protein NapC